MSTKTVTKRVALATVVALGAGILSLVTVSSANASFAGQTYSALGTATTTAAETLTMGTGAATGGSFSNSSGVSTWSLGLVNVGDIAGNSPAFAGTTQTATLLSTGELAVQTLTDTAHGVCFVTNGIIKHASVAAGTASINGSQTAYCTTEADTSTHAVAIGVAPVSGANFSVQLYVPSAADATTSNATAGTLTGQVNVTVATSSTSGVLSVAKSGIAFTGTSADKTATSDGANTGTVAYNQLSYATAQIADAFGSALTSGTGLVSISATNGALVAAEVNSNSALSPTVNSAYNIGTTAGGVVFAVKNPTAAPLSSVVTVSYNGSVVGTKTFTFTGEVAKVTLSSPHTGLISSSNATANTATISFADAAGNTIYPVASDGAWPTSGAISDSAIASGATSDGITTFNTPVKASNTAGSVIFACGATAGSGTIAEDYVNLSGTVIKSNALTVNCAGAAVTYTAAYDAAKYNPGSVAYLLITLKDSKGNLAADTTAANGSHAASITTGGMSGTAVTAPTTSDVPTNSVLKYTYIVGTTTGSYSNVVSLVDINSSSTPQANVTAGFTVADGSTSLNDVLKGIVSLIASINKQIAALAKLVAPAKKK